MGVNRLLLSQGIRSGLPYEDHGGWCERHWDSFYFKRYSHLLDIGVCVLTVYLNLIMLQDIILRKCVGNAWNMSSSSKQLQYEKAYYWGSEGRRGTNLTGPSTVSPGAVWAEVDKLLFVSREIDG